MDGLEIKQLVLIVVTTTSESGETTNHHGTGYFITSDLVLTAGHVLPTEPFEVKVRLEKAPPGDVSPWREVEPVPIWIDYKLDVALLKVKKPLSDVVEFSHDKMLSFEKNVRWYSTAYPVAATEKTEQGMAYKSSGLTGTLNVEGGGGQGSKELDLGVDYESEDAWRGISGAPVFVEGQLIGIIKSYKTGYKGKRLDGVPINQWFNVLEFQRAIKPRWLPLLPGKFFTLILASENSEDKFVKRVKSAVGKRAKEINKLAGLSSPEVKLEFIEVLVTDALQDPSHWYEVVEAICAAPIMVVDVTDYQPAVMLLLGIRAVVRRGVTIVVTSKMVDESALSELPFNIQESKLIYSKEKLQVNDPKHPINRIGEAIVKGLVQLQSNPNYLDLPAFDAVRCPKPKNISSEANAEALVGEDIDGANSEVVVKTETEAERILMLCTFNALYQDNWIYISEEITTNFEEHGKPVERMLDISSPRLVGQALYESIRWTPCCVVDWTRWRPNVFFELGVRLACSDIGPICLIAAEELSIEKKDFQVQKARLLKLLQPISYTVAESSAPFEQAYNRYLSFLNGGTETVDDQTTISHNATHRLIVRAYDWRQEAFAQLPHEELLAKVEQLQGMDHQKTGLQQILFSANPDLSLEIQRNRQERRIAAWCYFRKRYVPDDLDSEEFKNNPRLIRQLSKLTEEVFQELRIQSNPDHKRIYDEVVTLMDKLDTL